MARNKEKNHREVHNVSGKVRTARSQDFPSNEDMGESQRCLGSSVRWDLERQNKEKRGWAMPCSRSLHTPAFSLSSW